jgi:hypothetical protein
MPNAATSWHRATAVLLATALLGLGIHATTWPWIVDDAFIALRYSDRLALGQGLTFTDGERVEGYSQVAWVLLVAALRWLGCDALSAVRGLGMVCMLGVLVVLARSPLLPRSPAALLALPLLAATGCAATWTVAGLEGPLLLLALAVAFDRMVAAWRAPERRRPWLAAGAAFAVAALTRPDAPLFLVAAAFGTLFCAGTAPTAWRIHLRAIGWLVAVPIAVLSVHTICRLAYYGEWLPNTAVAKLAFSSQGRSLGRLYLESNLVATRALLLPALLGLLALARRESRTAVATSAIASLAWCVYLVHVGGDAFPRGRLFAPVLLPFTVLAAHGLHFLAQAVRVGAWATLPLAAGLVVLAAVDARDSRGDPRQTLSDWEWRGKATGEWLHRAFAGRAPLLAVDAAGAVPYYSRLPCLDMLGLCDHTIARTPYPANEPFVVAHARGNGPYVLARQPDLVLFGTPPGTPQPQWLGGRQLEADASFRADYRLVLFDLGVVPLENGASEPLRIPVWTRSAGRLGLRPDPANARRLELPGYWLGCYRQPYSFLQAAAGEGPVDAATLARDLQSGVERLLAPDAVGVLVATHPEPVGEVRRAGRLVAPAMPFPPGRYRVVPDGLPRGVVVTLAGPNVATTATDCTVLGSTPTAAVDVVLTVPEATALPFHVTAVRFERSD